MIAVPDSGLSLPAALLFDLDGTLIDTAPDFHRVLNRLLGEENRPLLSYETVRRSVSQGSRSLIETGFDLMADHPRFEGLRQRLLDHYLLGVAEESCLFEGAEELLRFLEDCQIPWGIVTNKPRRFAEPLLDALELRSRMATLFCVDDLPRSKPHPDPLLAAAAEIGCTPEDCWYAGDHERDIEAGRAAGMLTIAACYGYLRENDDASHWNANFEIHTLSELTQLLRNLSQPKGLTDV